MNIGLYSELARRHIVEIRKETSKAGIELSDAGMKSFRTMMIKSDQKHHKKILNFSDFYSLSELKDLLFHVQEHRFTIPQIKGHLDKLGLKFCGFQNKVAISNFRKLHGNEADIYDLELWHHYEERNPLAFAAMYQSSGASV